MMPTSCHGFRLPGFRLFGVYRGVGKTRQWPHSVTTCQAWYFGLYSMIAQASHVGGMLSRPVEHWWRVTRNLRDFEWAIDFERRWIAWKNQQLVTKSCLGHPKCALTYHGVQELDASLQLWSGLTVEPEQKTPNGLLFTQAEVVPLWDTKQQIKLYKKVLWWYSDTL